MRSLSFPNPQGSQFELFTDRDNNFSVRKMKCSRFSSNSSDVKSCDYPGREVQASSKFSPLVFNRDEFFDCVEGMDTSPEALTPSPPVAGPTSFLLRNTPNRFTRQIMLDDIYSMGFAGRFDFFYLPIDFKCGRNYGYCFINLEPDAVADFCNIYNARILIDSKRGQRVSKACEVHPAALQGQLAYRNKFAGSRVMAVEGHGSEEFRPIFFKNGQQIEIPLKPRTTSRGQTRNFPASICAMPSWTVQKKVTCNYPTEIDI